MINLDCFTAEESRKLLQFVLELLESREVYLDAALRLLDKLFGFRLNAYYIQDDPIRHGYSAYNVKSYTLSKEFLDQNQNQMFLDCITYWISERYIISNQDGIFYSQDAKEDAFLQSDYVQFLRENSFRCYAKILIDRSPIVGLIIIKSLNEEDFSESEKNVLAYIGRILKAFAQDSRKRYDEMNTLISTDELLDSLEVGRVIVNRKRHFSHYNDYFLSICRELSEDASVDSFTKEIIQNLEEETGKSIWNLNKDYVFTWQRYRIQVDLLRLKNINNKQEQYVLITIRSLNSRKDKLNPSTVIRYQLSKREAQVAAMMLDGKTYQQIASELYLSLPTVKSHVYNMFSKLNVNNKSSAINKLKEG